MQSRKDQVHAYFFVVGRLVTALLRGTPDAYEAPNRRLSAGMVIGLVLAMLAAAGFGVYGLFKPGGATSWRKAGAIIVVKETGARYVLLNGQLRPVLNYASARLAVNNANAHVVQVSRTSLTGVPVAAPIGIPGAPDSLPAANRLSMRPWTVCAQRPDASTPTPTPVTTLLLAAPAGTALPDGRGMIVATPDGTAYLVWQGQRYRMAGADVGIALGYGTGDAFAVTAGWLNPMPVGRDLAFPVVDRRGTPGQTVAGRPGVIGQVYEVRNSVIESNELYLLRSDGLARLSRTALVLADPATRQVYGTAPVAPIQTTPEALAGSSVSRSTDYTAGYPPEPPRLATLDADGQLCVRYGVRASGETEVSIAQLPGTVVRARAVPTGAHPLGSTVDRVVIPVGTGVLARDLPAPGATPGTEYLVTELGVKFPLSEVAVAQTLGYRQSRAVLVPNQLLELLPTGTVLSPTSALTDQSAQG